MARVESNDPDRMVYRSGGGCLMLFGLPFLLAGLFVMVSPFLAEKYRPKDSKTKEPVPVAGALLFGGLFAALGAGLMFGRAGKTLDRRADTVTTWWGVLVPFRRKHHHLSEFDRVTLSREVRRSKNSTYTVCPVRLRGPDKLKVTLEEPLDVNKARAAAEEVAKFLQRPLADSSMGSEVVREAAELDESVRDRSRRTGERPDVPPPPPGQRCRTRVVADTLCVEIPPTGFKKQHVIVAIVLAVAAAGGLAFFVALLADSDMPTRGRILLLGFIGLFFILVPVVMGLAMATRGVRLRKTVEVTPRELRVITGGLLRRKTVAIPSDELEELLIVSAKSVQGALLTSGETLLARSDRATACFGEGLSSEELAWLRAVVWNVVSA